MSAGRRPRATTLAGWTVGGVGLVACATAGVTTFRVFQASRAQRSPTCTGTDHPGEVTGEAPPNRWADVIVVFGGQAFERGPGRELTARLNHALGLWQRGAAPAVAVSGGLSGSVDEAAVMWRYLNHHGVPAECLLTLLPGDNTRLTLASARDALPAGTRLLGVSTRYHAHRIQAEARRQGLPLHADCPADSPELHNPDAVWVRYLTEVIACLVYAAPRPVEDALRAAFGRHRHSAASATIRLSRRLRTRLGQAVG